MSIQIRELDAAGIGRHLAVLCDVLIDSVAGGAAISFMAPLDRGAAISFWRESVAGEVEAGRRVLFVAAAEDGVAGTVQLILSMPPNQPHRAEVAKMIVHPRARRQGVGRLLIEAALTKARASGKTLVTLDTRTGDVAQSLYASAGFEVAGIIPDFALDPDGAALHGTTLMFRRL